MNAPRAHITGLSAKTKFFVTISALVAALLILTVAYRFLFAPGASAPSSAASAARQPMVIEQTHTTPVPEDAARVTPAGFLKTRSGAVLPRFASIARENVVVRGGPALQYPARWVFRRAGLPVEIVAERGDWRRIRDFEGEEGWVRREDLSARRQVMIAPWNRKITHALRARPDDGAPALALVKGGVVASVLGCDGSWCRLRVANMQGWMRQPQLWGVYADERVQSTASAAVKR